MTERSKAERWLRNRKDNRRQTMPTSGEIVARFAPACNCEDCIYPPQTTGISVRAGVGGRRHRKRRRAEERRAIPRYKPVGPIFMSVHGEMVEASREMWRTLAMPYIFKMYATRNH